MREKISNLIDFSQNTKKEVWFAGVYLLLGIMFWVSAFWGFSTKITDPLFLFLLFLAGLIWIVATVLADMLLPEDILATIFLFLFFFLLILFGLNLYNLIAVSLFAIAFYSAHKWARRIRENTIKFNAIFLSKKFLGIFFTGLAIFFAFASNAFILKDYAENPRISPEVYHSIFIPAEAIIDLFVPGYEKGMTAEEFQRVFLENVLPSFLASGLGNIDTSNVNVLNEEIASQTLEELTLEGVNDSMRSFVSASAYRGIVPFLFVIALFSAFKLFLWPVSWVAAGLTWVTIRVLSLYKIIIFREEQVVKYVPKLE
ncbi:MAG: hypothetical protein WD712_02555 [Candidatus Spechtbacterales bacterium]